MTEREARSLRAAIVSGADSLDDKTVSAAPKVLRRLTGDGSLVKSGTRIYWDGVIKRAAVDLWDNAESAPDKAPLLWEDVLYRDGIRIIPDTITIGLAFADGEQGWWGDTLYQSKLPSNVWTPEQYPDGWVMLN